MANSLNTHFDTINYPTLKPKLSLSMYNKNNLCNFANKVKNIILSILFKN